MIDLHGYHLHEAWKHFNKGIEQHYYTNYRNKVTVITGQGVIMREFPTWAQNHPLVKEIRQQPHNPGSFSVILLRRKQ